MILRIAWILSIALIFSCKDNSTSTIALSDYSELPLKYAKNFHIQVKGDSYIITTNSQENSSGSSQEIYCNSSDSVINPDALILNTVPDQIIVLSTTYLGYIESLNELNSIGGISNVDLIYSSAISEKVKSGAIVDVGNDVSLNYERIIELEADLILMYDFGTSTSTLIKRLESLGQKVIRINEFKELTPLGKAEWIKFFGILFGKYDTADRIFTGIENQYLKLLEQKKSFKNEPTVFTGIPWKGQWFQPGGKSFQASFFSDAGANYLWRDDEHGSGFTVDREVVFEKALEADFWMHPSNSLSKDQIIQEDERYSYFTSFKEGRIFNNNKRLSEKMGNDYWESGLLNPHLILADLMAIFHPEHFPNHEFYYYRKLE